MHNEFFLVVLRKQKNCDKVFFCALHRASTSCKIERLKMPSACALGIFSGKLFFISRLSRSAERSKRYFHGE